MGGPVRGPGLEELRIRGLGVIEEAVLELGPGLTVLTGETGAGKTMVLTALGLLLGGRADPARVRTGAERAEVEGRLLVAPDTPAAARAADAGAELDDGALLVARTVTAEGRSRAFLAGRSVPAGVLADLAEDLVAVHGQSDQLRLRRPAAQREAVDRFGGPDLLSLREAYAATWRRLTEVTDTLEEIRTSGRERAEEADLLRHGLAEIEAVAPVPGEDSALDEEIDRIGHADALRRAAQTAHAALVGDPAAADPGTPADAVGLLGAARHALDLVGEHDPALAGLAGRVAEAAYLVADVAGELASYAAAVDADPLRLAAAHERRAALTSLTRRYGQDLGAVLDWAAAAGLRLADLSGDDERLVALSSERQQLAAILRDEAAALTTARQAAGDRFAAAVTAELQALAMPHAEIRVAVRPTDAGPAGSDEVEIMLAAHSGAPELPLGKGASGGELSRVMLAVEVVLAGGDPVPTFVFDEVDAGVGGRAAMEVGARLARLARTAQVIVVTHLPQVAAFADHHLTVTKADDGRVTRSGVVRQDDEGRLRELARMLAGLEGSELARAHADELLGAAAATKADR